jgi:hypothetical protein
MGGIKNGDTETGDGHQEGFKEDWGRSCPSTIIGSAWKRLVLRAERWLKLKIILYNNPNSGKQVFPIN